MPARHPREETELDQHLEPVADAADEVTGANELLELGPDGCPHAGGEYRAGPDVVAGRESAREEQHVVVGDPAARVGFDLASLELLQRDDLGAGPEGRQRDAQLLVVARPFDRDEGDTKVTTRHGPPRVGRA